jgi:hypothetical protein
LGGSKHVEYKKGYESLKATMFGVANMGSWMAPFNFEVLNIIAKAWS